MWETILVQTAHEHPRCEMDAKDLRTKAAVLTLNDTFSGFLAIVKRTREDTRKWQLMTEVVQAYVSNYNYANKTVEQNHGAGVGLDVGSNDNGGRIRTETKGLSVHKPAREAQRYRGP